MTAMDRQEFLANRAAFAGLPYGALAAALDDVRSGRSWSEAFVQVADDLARDAARRHAMGADVSAAEAWRLAACAVHVASFRAQTGRMRALRTRARGCYREALALCPTLGEPLWIPVGTARLRGYLRSVPGRPPRGVVILVNGLDSMCEVELHAFGDVFLARDTAVLALDLPAQYDAGARVACPQVERIATRLRDWVETQPGLSGLGAGVFGVSFGGQLVARLLSGDRRFLAGVAVSPPARFGAGELAHRHLRRMLAVAFDVPEDRVGAELAPDLTIAHLQRPEGRLLLLSMQRDELFGAEHSEAVERWGRGRVERRDVVAEHVGTSRMHHWLPEAADWLVAQLEGGAP